MMNKIPVSELRSKIRTEGRSYFDSVEGVLYCNYTLGTWRFRFTGTALAADFSVMPGIVLPGMEHAPLDWPWIAVFMDGEEMLRQEVSEDAHEVKLFESGSPETHELRIVKLTENLRGELGLRALCCDGEIEAAAKDSRPVIEFIGDSITCGFGNATNEVMHEFVPSEEDGLQTHGAMAAAKLGLRPRFISVSGISVSNQPDSPLQGLPSMETIYEYTDRIIEERLGEARGSVPERFEAYDFSGNPAKYVVLNLGTNDATQIYMSGDHERAIRYFRERYEAFVRKIRALNGPDTAVICALGCMDYYLFDEIRAIAERLQQEDPRLYLLKYGKMMAAGPDAGACLHPTVYRHEKMAEELVSFIRNIEEAVQS